MDTGSKAKMGEDRGKASDSHGSDYQNAQDSAIPAAATNVLATADFINLPKETILGMDPTVALFVVFGIFLVLVVAIVASSKGGRSRD